MEILSQSEEETLALGRRLAADFTGGESVLLVGDLGAGKTVFTRGLALGLGVEENVISPTYVFLRSYRGQDLNLYHFDFYRLRKASEIERVGLSDFLDDKLGVYVVEWPEFFPNQIFKNSFRVNFKSLDKGKRLVSIEKS